MGVYTVRYTPLGSFWGLFGAAWRVGGGVKAELARLALANDRYVLVETIPTHQSDPGPVHWKYPRRTHRPAVLIWPISGVPTGTQ